MIRLKSVREFSNEGALISRKSYIVQEDNAGMFAEIHNMLTDAQEEYVKIKDQQGNVLYYAYNDEQPGYDEIDRLLDEFEIEKAQIFIHELFPEVQVVQIHGFNEWAYRFSNLLTSYDVQVYTLGNVWKDCGFDTTSTFNTLYNEGEVLHVYAEGYQDSLVENRGLVDSWHLLPNIGKINSLHVAEEYGCKVRKDNIMTAFFPEKVESKNMEEDYRQRLHLNPSHDNFAWTHDFLIDQICRVNGYKITRKQWFLEQTRRQREILEINHIKFRTKTYGSGQNKIYLIGPGIVDARYVMNDGEGLAYCIYRQLMQTNMSYSVVSIEIDSQDYLYYKTILEYLKVDEKDLILLIAEKQNLSVQAYTYQSDISMKQILDRRLSDWYYDKPLHTNFEGNKQLAKIIVQENLLSRIHMLQTEIHDISEPVGNILDLEQEKLTS